MNLYRNNTGASYPYQIPGLISITGSSAGAAFYYYFYDWEVIKDPCVSPRAPVALLMEQVTAAASISTLGMTATVVTNASNNATQYSWNFGDNTSSTQATPTHLYTLPGTYPLTLIANNDHCSDTLNLEVVVDNASLNELSGSNWVLYPNPANERLNVEFSHGIASSVCIVDAAGRMVMECPIQSALSSLNISGLARGTYRVIANFSDGTRSVKPFVKQD
jgi:PKD repeat protein